MGVQVDTLAKNSSHQDFISFTFDGKPISEFGLVAVTSGDRLSFAGSSDVENEVSSINGVNGQYYWGTNFKSLKRDFTLATDGMTEAQVQAFKYHFRPGRYGLFTEPQYINRESYCRVSEVSQFSVIPFKKVQTISYKTEDGVSHTRTVQVNEYKGEIKLTFEWDFPYFTGIKHYIDRGEYNTTAKFNKIYPAMFTDNIPLSTSLEEVFLVTDSSMLGMGVLGKMIFGKAGEISDVHLGSNKKLRHRIKTDTDENGSAIYSATSRLISESQPEAEGSSIKGMKIFYNPSTAPTYPIITFNIDPTVTTISADNWKPVYFNDIADRYNTLSGPQYNTIQVSKQIVADGGTFNEDASDVIEKEFFYSSPHVISSIHRAIEIAYKHYNKQSTTLMELQDELRSEITHDRVLKWAIAVSTALSMDITLCTGDIFNKNATTKILASNLAPLGYSGNDINGTWFAHFNILMLYFFSQHVGNTKTSFGLGTEYKENGIVTSIWSSFMPLKIVFDGENSKTTIDYKGTYNAGTINLNLKNFTVSGEKCGDMAYSSYLELEGGDTINSNSIIMSCRYMKFKKGADAISQLDNITLKYKYLYL